MTKILTCIECPKGCKLTIDFAEDGSIRVGGNQCKKGERYGIAESTNPVRILTSSVLTVNQPIKMLPVRTDKPIPKERILDAMNEVKKVRIKKNVSVGDILVENFLNLGVNLIATREISRY
jgi:CxxC motif-containing protein